MQSGAFYVSRGCINVKRKSVVCFFPVPVTLDQGLCKCFKHTAHLSNVAKSEGTYRVPVLADLSHHFHVIMPCFSKKLLHFVPPYYRNCLSGTSSFASLYFHFLFTRRSIVRGRGYCMPNAVSEVAKSCARNSLHNLFLRAGERLDRIFLQ